MKTLTSLLFTCVSRWQAAPKAHLTGLLLTGILSASAAVQADETVTLKVAADPSSIPFAYMDQKSHRMEGFDMDLIRALGGIAGYKVQILPLDFAGIIPALQSGNIDAAASSVTITDARKKVIDFSSPYYDSGLQILVRDSDKSINTIDDLKGKTVAALTGTTGYNFTLQALGSTVKLVPYSTSATAFLALVSGSVDAVISDQPVVANYAQNAGKGRAKVVGPLYHGEQFGIAFAKGSKWVEPTNKALEQLKADGTYATLYTKWFGNARQNTPAQ
ncbi:MAG: basic amino acid transporter substrate-binding protein [Pseudomonas sp.]|jgi:glutamine transport system substrate-binding protein|uniref:transporter substrate-binding domain-containing protein n=1 Tax=Pseudomonas sp. TaxID=306 RepID=UPI002612CFA7|nr:transporter substrate-binding domain-containing protein [Pseudomonas sp.]MDB6047708.1 basic amino acid transporter substrate-binding protein [Pseudomonas sp.]